MVACYRKAGKEPPTGAPGGLSWKMIRWDINAQTAFKEVPQRVFWGLTDPELPKYIKEGLDFVYVDNPYFNRSSQRNTFRLIRKNVHLTTLLERPDDRARKFGLKLLPWRKGGLWKDIVVIPPSPYYEKIYGAENWLKQTVNQLMRVTSREIRVKYNKSIPLEGYLKRTHAVVTFGSTAGVEAAMLGVPVFSGPICPSLPVTAGNINHIDNPHYPENRQAWLNGLAYATWTFDEFQGINKTDYWYEQHIHCR